MLAFPACWALFLFVRLRVHCNSRSFCHRFFRRMLIIRSSIRRVHRRPYSNIKRNVILKIESMEDLFLEQIEVDLSRTMRNQAGSWHCHLRPNIRFVTGGVASSDTG
jgi:hypothetical protein